MSERVATLNEREALDGKLATLEIAALREIRVCPLDGSSPLVFTIASQEKVNAVAKWVSENPAGVYEVHFTQHTGLTFRARPEYEGAAADA